MKTLHPNSLCVQPERNGQGLNTPIYPSSAYAYRGYDENLYPRYFNTENQQVLIRKMAELEHAETSLLFSSGMAAISTTLLGLLRPGDHVLFSNEIYGGTHKFITYELDRWGVKYDFVQSTDMEAFEAAILPSTKIIYTESPSNPLATIVDLEHLAQIAKSKGVITLIDNTFATPINQNPIDLGIDVVLHSGTKYLGGHSDLCFGVAAGPVDLMDQVFQSAINLGGSLNALDSYLIERSLKTLALRVHQHNTNAQTLAEFLEAHDAVKHVHYPGLSSHPGHQVAKKQMTKGFGGMLAFELIAAERTDAFLDHLKLVTPALSLGGVETIICQPSKTSHLKMAEADRLKLGITDGTLRLSVGIEHPEDLIHDFEQALEVVAVGA